MASSSDSVQSRVLALRHQLAVPMPTTDAPGDTSGNPTHAEDTSRNTAAMFSWAEEREARLGETSARREELVQGFDLHPPCTPSSPPAGDLIDVRIRELEREQGWLGVMNNLGLEYRADGRMVDGDTLVVMQFPDAVGQWPTASNFVRCDGSQWRSVKFRVHSHKLRHMGSNVFSEMFQPKQQARILRRLRLTFDKLPSGISFVLDLTPPSEGDESASLLAMLSLPFSVRAWWQSRNRLGVRGSLVSGHDDSCPEHKTVPVNCTRIGSATRTGLPDSQDSLMLTAPPRTFMDPDDIAPCPSREIPDYCPIRHRASILRLLESIECGVRATDLDSAPRVFTMAKIAKHFECITAVRDHICSWFMDSDNSQFIEVHPETALSISWDLELRDLTRVAFRIRVVEDAIELVDHQPVSAVQQLNKKTVFGRPREPLSDELETAIEHGRVRLIERVRHTAGCLLSHPHSCLDFLFGSCPLADNQWQLLVAMGEFLDCHIDGHENHSSHATMPLRVLHDARNALEELELALGAYVKASVSCALERPLSSSGAPSIDTGNHVDFEKADLDRKCYYVGWSSLQGTRSLYQEMSSHQRLLTTYPWEMLKSRLGDLRYLNTFCSGGISIPTRVERLNQCLTPLAQYLPGDYVKLDAYGVLNVFEADAFALQLSSAVSRIADTWIGNHELEIPLLRTNFLALGLSPDELAYLPLWAGGNNDETGGIFNEHAVPDADMGPIQPGPSYHTGCSVPSLVSSIAQSTPTVSADSDASDETMTAGVSIRAVPTTRAASSVRPSNDNAPPLGSTLHPAAHGGMAADTTDRTSLGSNSSEIDREDDFDFTLTDDDSDEDWVLFDASSEYVV